MRTRIAKFITPLAFLILLALLIAFMLDGARVVKERGANILLLPSLPKPIAKEYALITSAGQSTDAYIVCDVANKLMIHNYFMPQAKEMDLEGVNTLVFVVGYSSLGEKLHETSVESEKERVAVLLAKAKRANMSVITVYLESVQSREGNTEELLRLITPESDYIIATKEANNAAFLSELLKESRIPVTLISSPRYLAEPFASAFR